MRTGSGAIILDSCGLVNMLAISHFREVLSAVAHRWYVPVAVETKAHKYRQPDPEDPEKLISVTIDLTAAFDDETLFRCDCSSNLETELYVSLAGKIDDGDAMGLALAKSRGFKLFTDDIKVRTIAANLQVEVVGTPSVLMQWHKAVKSDDSTLSHTIQSIEKFANYFPCQTVSEYGWWQTSKEVC